MNWKLCISMILAVGLLAVQAQARSAYTDEFVYMYPWTIGTQLDTCELCHGSTKKIRNPYGLEVESWLDGGSVISSALKMSENTDSDGDGFYNYEEIDALSLPGDSASFPSASCTDADNDLYAIEGGSCGAVDCNDNDVAVNPGVAEDCSNGIDDDCDGLIDTMDPDAVGCPVTCTDADTDSYAVEGDTCGPVDCNDSNGAVNPGAVEDCINGIDDDCDDYIDDADTDCGACVPTASREKGKKCSDGFDNDCDGVVDAADSDCGGDTGGGRGDPEICDDGIDNDGDGKTDCSDKKDCGKDPVC